MKSIKLNGFELIDEANGKYVGVPITGLDSPVLNVSTYERSGYDGIRIPSIYSRERRITITGIFRDNCPTPHIDMRQELVAVVTPDRDSSNRLNTKLLEIQDFDNVRYQLNVQVVGLKMDRAKYGHTRYLLDLLCEDYEIFSNIETETVVSLSTGGGLTIPFSIPFSFVGGVDGSATATNGGDMVTYPVVELAGPLTNPRITNQTTGNFTQVNVTVNVGHTLTIDMKNRTVLLGSVNKLGNMTSNSVFWGLEQGENDLVLTSGSTGDTGTATFSFRSAWSGI